MAWIPEGLTLAAALGLVGASFLGSFITISFGLGGGIFLLAVMASLLPPAALIPVHGVVQLGSNLGRATLMARFIRWRIVWPFALGALAGVALGAGITLNLPPAMVQLGVGLFILWSVIWSAPKWLTQWPVLTGAVTSFLTMFFGATGPFVATYTKARKLDRQSYAGTHAALMVTQHMLKSLAFAGIGFAFAPWAVLIAAMIFAGVLGALAGKAVLARMHEQQFKLALNTILVLVALRLVWTSVQVLWPHLMGNAS